MTEESVWNKGEQSEEQRNGDGISQNIITPEGEANLARHKQELSEKVATAVKEIEELRQRQLELEREKSDLEELKRRQEEYESGKKELIENLGRALVLLEKEEEQTIQLREILAQTRGRFRDMLGDLRKIDESTWQSQNFRSELMKSIAMIESTRAEYRRSLARIEAMTSQRSALSREIMQTGIATSHEQVPGILYWLKAGLGIGLAFLLLGGLCAGVWLLVRTLLG
jgi:molecular chaperone GrpE (heat shock protein)